jgi:hypothetical protein
MPKEKEGDQQWWKAGPAAVAKREKDHQVDAWKT